MLGRRLEEKGGRKPSKLDELLMKMETALEGENFEELPDLVEEFEKELERSVKGGYVVEETLHRFQRVLKHLEERAKRKLEELQRREKHLKNLKSYGEFG